MAIADAFKSFIISTAGGVILWQLAAHDDPYSHWSPALQRGGTLTPGFNQDALGIYFVKEADYVAMATVHSDAVATVDATQVLNVLSWLLCKYRDRDPFVVFELTDGWIHEFLRFEREKKQRLKQEEIDKARKKPDPPPPFIFRVYYWFRRNLVRDPDSAMYSNYGQMVAEMIWKLECKNVAVDAARAIADAVCKDIPQEQLLSRKVVYGAFENVLQRILAPERVRNLMSEVSAARTANRVFSIVVMGVNGVGKSTTLAKLAHFMRRSLKCSVMIAACDTFRSGAVEQLRLHSKNLGMTLFDRGYGVEPHIVAQGALRHAKEEGIDVVLIDTAGRMQDNAPLMDALGKLVSACTVDLLLFVGEALVGNDGLDQLMKFDQAVRTGTAGRGRVRGVDGIILTKFDCVDDKIGAAISLAYQSERPIFFVGTGQSYEDLRVLEPKDAVETLLA